MTDNNISYRNRIPTDSLEYSIKLLQAEREGKATKKQVKDYVNQFDIDY